MLLGGSFKDFKNITVAADGKLVGQFSSVPAAMFCVMSLHYILNVQYNSHIKLAMLFIEQHFCGLKPVAGESYKSVVALKSKISACKL